ncbi:MAG: hypothetical protein QXW80_00305 [Candidatus Micrarchaeia archaeon]
MAEREEKKGIKKPEEKEQNKPSLWQRMKKPLAAGLLGASLLFSPAKKVDAVGFEHSMDPPTYIADIIEKDKDLRIGWKLLLTSHKKLTEDRVKDKEYIRKFLQRAIEIFDKVYKERGDSLSLYLKIHGTYYLAVIEPNFESTEERCKEVLKLAEERLKKNPNDFDFIDIDFRINLNLAEMYYDGYTFDPSYMKDGYIDHSKMSEYKEKTMVYVNKGLTQYDKIKEKWDQFEYSVREIKYSREYLSKTGKIFYETNYFPIMKEILEKLKKNEEK